MMPFLPSFFRRLAGLTACALSLGIAACSAAEPTHGKRAPATSTGKVTPAPASAKKSAPAPAAAPTPTPAPAANEGVFFGIDVLEQQGFASILGKRVGLLTQPAGVNRFGMSTIDVLRRDKRVQLVALYGPEHGIYGNEKAEIHIPDRIDERTGLHVFSLYGPTRKPTPAMLKGVEVMLIDLQDIGVRSYTYVSCMRLTIEACFQNNVDVIVLDRPNPLGGLKVGGPPLDKEWLSYVGAFRVPYVHGLTIGELARIAASEPGVLQIPEEVRTKGRLTVVPMRGWSRSMTWPQTGLKWVPTSPNIPSFDAVVGYSMTGLGAQLGGFRHGIGTPHPFRLLTHPSLPPAALAAELNKRAIAGVRFVPITVKDAQGRDVSGLFVDVTDWSAWRPTDLSFHMMQIACSVATSGNPFAAAKASSADLYNKHVGSTLWWNAISKEGARVNVGAFLNAWEASALAFQRESRRYWLYQ